MTVALLEVRNLSVEFSSSRGVADRVRRVVRPGLRAVDGVDLAVRRGTTLGLVGESGCGKSTLARAVVGLEQPVSGSIQFEGEQLGLSRSRSLSRRIQMVFQDPSSSLNPAMTVRQTLAELLRFHRMVPRAQVEDRCRELLHLVELPEGILDSRPRSLSGGQRQRVAIARSLAMEPDLLISDEVVASLDVSVQAAIVNLLKDLQDRLELTLIFISHDLSVVRQLCAEVAVMYLGRIVETAPVGPLFGDPRHPYTKALMTAAPTLEGSKRSGESALRGEPPSALAVPEGCRFSPRCPIAADVCRTDEPLLTGGFDSHLAACHFAWRPRTEPDAQPRHLPTTSTGGLQ